MKKPKKDRLWKKILLFSSKILLYAFVTVSVILVWQHKIRPVNTSEKEPETVTYDAVVEARLDYYGNRVEALESDLLDTKKQLYIAETDYRALLREYEEFLLSALDNTPQEPMSDTGTDADTDAEPEPEKDTPDETTEAPEIPVIPVSDGEDETVLHFIVENGEITITECSGGDGEIVIPSEISGLPVTSIAEGAFRSCPYSDVILPASVTDIGWFAFADSPSLRSVSLSGNVISIGYEAFAGCPVLHLICPADSYAARYAASYGIPREEPS